MKKKKKKTKKRLGGGGGDEGGLNVSYLWEWTLFLRQGAKFVIWVKKSKNKNFNG